MLFAVTHSICYNNSKEHSCLLVESNLHIVSLNRRLSDPDLSSSINLGEDYASATAGIPIPSQTIASTSHELIANSFSSSPIVKLTLEQRSRNNSGVSMRDLAAVKSKECSAAPVSDADSETARLGSEIYILV